MKSRGTDSTNTGTSESSDAGDFPCRSKKRFSAMAQITSERSVSARISLFNDPDRVMGELGFGYLSLSYQLRSKTSDSYWSITGRTPANDLVAAAVRAIPRSRCRVF